MKRKVKSETELRAEISACRAKLQVAPAQFALRLAALQFALALLLATLRRFAEAAPSIGEVVAIYRAQKGPEFESRARLAKALFHQGRVDVALDRFHEAEAELAESAALWTELARQSPPTYGADAAKALRSLANLRVFLQKYEDASREYAEARNFEIAVESFRRQSRKRR